jgi:multidrug transporter EmrE-like cation transporter
VVLQQRALLPASLRPRCCSPSTGRRTCGPWCTATCWRPLSATSSPRWAPSRSAYWCCTSRLRAAQKVALGWQPRRGGAHHLLRARAVAGAADRRLVDGLRLPQEARAADAGGEHGGGVVPPGGAPRVVLAVAMAGRPAAFPAARRRTELAYALLSGLATVAPLMLFAYAAQRMPLSIIGPMQYIVPSMNFLIGWQLYDEPLSATKLFGFALVWLGLVCSPPTPCAAPAAPDGGPRRTESARLRAASDGRLPRRFGHKNAACGRFGHRSRSQLPLTCGRHEPRRGRGPPPERAGLLAVLHRTCRARSGLELGDQLADVGERLGGVGVVLAAPDEALAPGTGLPRPST